MRMDGFDGGLEIGGESIDDVQGDDGNANALLGSFCLTTLRVVAKLHVSREADGER